MTKVQEAEAKIRARARANEIKRMPDGDRAKAVEEIKRAYRLEKAKGIDCKSAEERLGASNNSLAQIALHVKGKQKENVGARVYEYEQILVELGEDLPEVQCGYTAENKRIAMEDLAKDIAEKTCERDEIMQGYADRKAVIAAKKQEALDRLTAINSEYPKQGKAWSDNVQTAAMFPFGLTGGVVGLFAGLGLSMLFPELAPEENMAMAGASAGVLLGAGVSPLSSLISETRPVANAIGSIKKHLAEKRIEELQLEQSLIDYLEKCVEEAAYQEDFIAGL